MGKPYHRTLEARGAIAATHMFSWVSYVVLFSASVYHTIRETLHFEEVRSSGKPLLSPGLAWPRLPCLFFYLINAAVSTLPALFTCHSDEGSGAR